MSYSYETTGYFLQQHGPNGEFVEGDLLALTLTEADKAKLESQNPEAAQVVEEAIGLARVMIVNDRFGDFQTGRFKILINGHVQTSFNAWQETKSYCQIRIEAL